MAHFADREFEMVADLSRLPQVREFAREVARDFGFEPEESFQVMMAASEATANAIEHGSTRGGDTVAVRATEEEGALALYVTDTGEFVPCIARGSLPERGRGLDTMTRLMDEVSVMPGPRGTVIRLAKRPCL